VKLPLTLACGVYDRMVPLFTGEVRPEGIELNFIPMPLPRETFDRMAGGLEFDLSEFSSSEFISRYGTGSSPFVAIPVFPSRLFRHGFIAVNPQRIRAPKDLEGKRVGVALYTMTAAVWIKGLLQHEYGVDLSTIRWLQGAIEVAGPHGNPTVPPLVRPVPIEINRSGRSLNQLLADGELDAVIGSRLAPALGTSSNVARLFPNYPEVERDYFRRTGIFPIMHLVAIRRDVFERHPFVATSLYKAFCRSKELALERMRFSGMLQAMLPWMLAEVESDAQIFGADPWPYGVEPNRVTLQALVGYMVDQGLIERAVTVDELFVPTFVKPTV